ncbi:MAG: outer membrane protein assembly factor BamD [Candidatus Poribacteria bacterium]
MRTLLVCLIIATFLAGCAGKTVDENDPAALFKEAEEEISSDHYQIALEKLRVIKNKFPYSKYSLDAQLRIADVYFLEESFTEAAASYESFRDLHPKHEKVAYAMYKIGKSYFKDMPGSVARDLTSAQKALDAYNDFIRMFPNAKESEEVRADVTALRNTLAEKELYVADFYFKRDLFDSALPRYKKILQNYPETKAAREAEKKITSAQKQKKASSE